MKTIEFETLVENMKIEIPAKYHLKDYEKVKVIVVYNEFKEKGNYDKKRLLSEFKRAQELGIFKNIENSVAWQKDMRSQWEH